MIPAQPHRVRQPTGGVGGSASIGGWSSAHRSAHPGKKEVSKYPLVNPHTSVGSLGDAQWLRCRSSSLVVGQRIRRREVAGGPTFADHDDECLPCDGWNQRRQCRPADPEAKGLIERAGSAASPPRSSANIPPYQQRRTTHLTTPQWNAYRRETNKITLGHLRSTIRRPRSQQVSRSCEKQGLECALTVRAAYSTVDATHKVT